VAIVGAAALVYVGLIGGLAVCLLALAFRRYRALHRIRVAPIAPLELKRRLDAGEKPVILDLRHPLDALAHAYVIPGAVRVVPDEMGQAAAAVPMGADVVFYCTCPREASTLHVLEALHARGLRSARPLEGGLAAWRRSGFDIEPVMVAESAPAAGTAAAAN
jgi:rhodanese-related sulfurtransferase